MPGDPPGVVDDLVRVLGVPSPLGTWKRGEAVTSLWTIVQRVSRWLAANLSSLPGLARTQRGRHEDDAGVDAAPGGQPARAGPLAGHRRLQRAAPHPVECEPEPPEVPGLMVGGVPDDFGFHAVGRCAETFPEGYLHIDAASRCSAGVIRDPSFRSVRRFLIVQVLQPFLERQLISVAGNGRQFGQVAPQDFVIVFAPVPAQHLPLMLGNSPRESRQSVPVVKAGTPAEVIRRSLLCRPFRRAGFHQGQSSLDQPQETLGPAPPVS